MERFEVHEKKKKMADTTLRIPYYFFGRGWCNFERYTRAGSISLPFLRATKVT